MERYLRASASSARVISLWALLLGCFNIAGLRPSQSVRADSQDMVKIPAVAGGDATLPCDTRPSQASDSLLLVVWYKDDVPIYSYDGRVKGPTAHWADDILGGRARWHPATPSSLRIRDVSPTDRAVYRCRLDFKISPTRNHKIQLEVIELPEKPQILDEFGKELIGVAGPYVEGASLKLTCVVSGGKPRPRVRWWRDDKLIATLAPVDDDFKKSRLELTVSKLTREYFEAVYSCTADNTQMVPAPRVNIQVQIYLRPLFVEILPREQPLSVGHVATLACRAVGARPPAVITWWIDERQITAGAIQKNSDDKNETISYLQWTPRMDDDGKVLTCRAAHVKLEHTAIETSIKLNLHYVPIVKLHLGAKLNPNDIEEGDDVYFDCVVKSNPPVYKVIWEHNDQIMTHNQRAGVIAGTANLALQNVHRAQAGKYACTASNVEGDGKSFPVQLQVIYKPVCSTATTVIVGAALNELTKIKCEVDAHPSPNNFQWTLNNSVGTLDLEADKFTMDKKGRSILSYTPTTERDYGSLICRATNLAGQQMEPCRYTLLPAVRPDQLTNCTSVNLTDDSAEIRCIAGYDGGLRTSYFVEVWETKNLIANVSTPSPAWILQGLGSQKTLKLVFYAYNSKGRSEATVIRINTLSRLALQTEAILTSSSGADSRWALAVIAGIAGTLIAILIIALVVRKKQHLPMQYEAPVQTVKAYKGSIQSNNHSPVQPDDKNPDVVPLGKDFNSSRELERPPEPPPYRSVAASRSNHSISNQETRSATPHTPGSDAHSIGTLAEDRRSVTSGTFTRRREVVTTRTPLLANARESCV